MLRRTKRLATAVAAAALAIAPAFVVGAPAQAQSVAPAPGEANSGDLIVVGGNICTLTRVRNHDGQVVSLTSGHCGTPGTPVAMLTNPFGPVGVIDHVDGPLDVAYLRISAPGIAQDLASPVLGEQACVATRQTPSTCGTQSPSDIPGRVWVPGACTVSGYSGAPVTGADGRLIGIVKGSAPIPCVGPVAVVRADAMAL